MAKCKKPKSPPPFDVTLAAKLTKGSTDPEDIVRALSSLGLAIPVAATLVDMEENEFRDLLANTELGKAWRQAEALTDATVCNKLLEQCRKGNVGAIRFWLSSRLPEQFAPSKPGRKDDTEPAAKPLSPLSDLKVIG